MISCKKIHFVLHEIFYKFTCPYISTKVIKLLCNNSLHSGNNIVNLKCYLIENDAEKIRKRVLKITQKVLLWSILIFLEGLPFLYLNPLKSIRITIILQTCSKCLNSFIYGFFIQNLNFSGRHKWTLCTVVLFVLFISFISLSLLVDWTLYSVS